VGARIALTAVAALVAAGMAIELHAHRQLTSSVKEIRAEIAAKPDPARNEKARDDALHVAGLQPGSAALFVAIGLDDRAGRIADAERLALRATRREPRNFATWLTLGVIRQARRDAAGAAAAYAKVKQLNPLYRTPG
jgi:Flp pilus assembly protein TadD